MPEGSQLFASIKVDQMVLAGYNPMTELAGEDLSDFILINSLDFGFRRSVDASGQLRGHVEFQRLTLTKHVDAATPLLAQAIARGSSVQLAIKAFDNNPSDGADRLHYTVTLGDARVTAHDVDAMKNETAMETVGLAYSSMDLAYSGDTQTETTIEWNRGGGGA